MDIFVHCNQHQECSAPSNMDYQRSRCRCKCVNKSPYTMDPRPVTNRYIYIYTTHKRASCCEQLYALALFTFREYPSFEYPSLSGS